MKHPVSKTLLFAMATMLFPLCTCSAEDAKPANPSLPQGFARQEIDKPYVHLPIKNGTPRVKLHWVRRDFGRETTASSCGVFWYDELSPPGDVRLPKWWRVLYRSGKEWKEVENPSGYGIAPDKFNVVTFKPVKTTALRLEVQCQDGRAMGIYEWQYR